MANILLVDDDVAILKFGEVVLGKFGFKVTTSDNVLDSIEKIKNNQFDLVITDANMPRFSGFDLVRTIRSDSKYKNLAVAMLTGRRDKEDIKKAIELGIDDYIIKPIKPEVFIQKVRSLIDRKSQATKNQQSQNASYKIKAQGSLRLDIDIVEIDEQGVTFHSPQFFDKGLKLSLAGMVFSENGLQLPPVKIAACTPQFKDGKEYFESKTVYCGATEAFRKQLNEWIENESQSKAA